MKILEPYSLLTHNTFRMDVSCRRFVEIERPEDVLQLPEEDIEAPFYVLGMGSNTLFTRNYEGTILHPVFQGITTVAEDDLSVSLKVAAGVEWEMLIDYCAEKQYYGLENLTGIPGLVGSAPVQNIGAYGVEVKDSITAVEGFLLPNKEPFLLHHDECDFGYRTSIFKTKLKGYCFITHVTFKLSKEAHYTMTYKGLTDELSNSGLTPSIDNIVRCVRFIREHKLPNIQEVGCAGSFFKNPIVPMSEFALLQQHFPDLVSYPASNGVKLAAGQLIEKAGWKGYRCGDAGIYPKQALVVVNYGNARPEEIVQLYENVIRDVYNIFHITLQPEVNIV